MSLRDAWSHLVHQTRSTLPTALRSLQGRRFLRTATDILGHLRPEGDSPWVKALKVLTVMDSLDRLLFVEVRGPVREFLENRNLIETSNESFVDLFFHTPLHTLFTIHKVTVGDHNNIVVAKHDQFGTLYFIEDCHGKPYLWRDVWHLEGFPFDHVMNLLWSTMADQIQVDIRWDPTGVFGSRAMYTSIPLNTDPVFGSSKGQMENLICQHERYRADRVARTYLFVGPPGCGKSTAALRFAQTCHGKLLKIEAGALTQSRTHDLDFLINGMQPTFMLIDDIDRAEDLRKSLPSLFATLDSFQTKHPTVTVILTANSLEDLDPALLRPGRISTLVEFQTPNLQDRLEILEGYLTWLGLDTTPADVVATATDGLTADYLREFTLQLRYHSVEEVLSQVKDRLRILKTQPLAAAETQPLSTQQSKAQPCKA